MENHPIPQDVTGFKFKLIGSITLKQFGYIMAAGILGLIIFILPGVPFLLKLPIIGFFAAFALALAFVPIEGRPMDKMIVNFIKVLPADNRYIYRKQGVNLQEYEIFKPIKVVTAKATPKTQVSNNSKKNAFASALRSSSFRPDKDEMEFFQNIKTVFDNPAAATRPILPQQAVHTQQPVSNPVQPVMPPQNPIPSPETVQPVIKTPIYVDKNVPLPNTASVPLPVHNAPSAVAPVIPAEPVLPTSVERVQAPVTAQKLENATNVKSVDANQQYNAGFPILPDIPNVVLGIIKDPRGKVLPNVLVEILDKNDIPVRAFKTNALGQFASATPLPNGTFKILFDDPQKKNEFETVEISLSGTDVFQPLEIISVDDREKLRRELFGATV